MAVGAHTAAVASPAGRRLVGTFTRIFRSYFIGFFIGAVQMLYIPVTRQLLNVWDCEEATCRAGEWHPIPSPSLDPEAAALGLAPGLGVGCRPCPFLPLDGLSRIATAGPEHCPLADDLCPPVTSLRLRASADLDCVEAVWPYHGVASALLLVSFTLGIPYIFARLVQEHARRYDQLPTPPDMSEDEQWAYRVHASHANKARSLYADFENAWRGYKVLVLIQKLVLVVVTVLLGHRWPVAALGLQALIHFAMAVMNAVARPYLDPRPDMVAVAIALVSAANPAAALAVLAGGQLPPWSLVLLIAGNVCLPALALAVGSLLVRGERHRTRGGMAAESAAPGSQAGRATLDVDGKAAKLQRQHIDRGINDYTLGLLVMGAVVVLTACVLAAAVVALGAVDRAVTVPVVPTTTSDLIARDTPACAAEDAVRSLELLEYGTWAAFVAHCCCMARPAPGDVPLVELWACDNGLFKERQRRAADDAHIHGVRPFCGTAMPEPVWLPGLRRLAVAEPDGELVVDYW